MSDANLLLGRLPVGRALSGGLVLDAGMAREAFRALAARSGGEGDEVALAGASLDIAVARMAGAVREVSVHRGFDPRDFTLLGFGGAGPMHAMPAAEELGISRVLVPRFPGHLSALGQMLADLRHDTVAAWGGRMSELEIDKLQARAGAMRDNGTAKLEADGMPRDRHRHEFTLDVRYVGQSFTLPIRWNPADADWTPLRAAFDERHEDTFGYADPANDIEIVNVRLVSIGEVDKPVVDFTPAGGGDPVIEHRPVWFGAWIDTPVVDRERLASGWRVEGPAIIEEAGGTTVAPPGWTMEVDATGALMCEGNVRW